MSHSPGVAPMSETEYGLGGGDGYSYGEGAGRGRSDGDGDEDGSGYGYGYGYGYGEDVGCGRGDGCGLSDGCGYEDGRGYGGGQLAGCDVAVRHGVVIVGCESHPAADWERCWREIAARHRVEVTPEIERDLVAVLRLAEELCDE